MSEGKRKRGRGSHGVDEGGREGVGEGGSEEGR